MKLHNLPIITLLGIATTGSASAVTLLTNFFAEPPRAGVRTNTAATAADFAANDSDVVLTSTVNNVSEADNGGTLGSLASTAITGDGINANVAATNVFFFTPEDANAIGATPILDGYLANGGTTPATDTITVTISSLEEIATGETINLVVYASGDAGNQGGDLTVTHGGTVLNDTTAGLGAADPFATFSITKEAGVDEITIANAGESQFKAINGFSITTPIPEPSSALLASLAGLALLRRRSR